MTEPNSRTLVRGLRILALFRSAPVLSQAAIADRLRLPLSTVGRLCRALVAEGFLEWHPSRLLAPGAALRDLASSLPREGADLAGQWMRELSEMFDEPVNLAVLDGPDVVYIASTPGRRALAVSTPTGSRAPSHAVAVGKALLADLSDEAAHAVLGDGPYAQLTPNTVASWVRLQPALAEIRRTGVATTWEEYGAGIASFAITVPSVTGGPPTGIALTAPTPRMTPELVRHVSDALSRRSASLRTGNSPAAPTDGGDTSAV